MQPVPSSSAWAVRLWAGAAEVDAVARELSRAADDVGLRGAAGAALHHLVADVAAEVRALGTACERAAADESAGHRGA